MSQSVVILTPNGRRQTIKVDANKTILFLLETVCQKFSFDSDLYNLKFHNKILDLNVMFRYSGLPNNCTLEMVETDAKRTATDIEICVQFEDGARKTGNFKSSTFLHEIINQLCPEKSQPDQNPLIIYMRKEVYGEDLAKTNLKSLGLQGGKALMRFLNKNPEELKVQANVSAPLPQKPKEEVEEPIKKRNVPTASVSVTPDLIKTLKEEKLVPEVKNEEQKEDEKMEIEETVEDTKPVEPEKVERIVEIEEKMEEAPLPEPEIHLVSAKIIYAEIF